MIRSDWFRWAVPVSAVWKCLLKNASRGSAVRYPSDRGQDEVTGARTVRKD